MEILLRTPNLSYILQEEDTANFKELKAEWRIQKYKASNKLNKDRKTNLVLIKSLGFKHLIQNADNFFRASLGSVGSFDLVPDLPVSSIEDVVL